MRLTKALYLIVALGMSWPSLCWSQGVDSYFRSRVSELAVATENDLAQVTAENWPDLRAQWRDELREMLGIPVDLAKTDLKATTVGSVAVEGVVIDRMHYQSRPGLYVAANLYLPDGDPPEDGWPAVLYVCGHARVTDHGRLLGNKTSYQHHGLWLARHGMACLMIDTIQLGEFHGEHHGTYKLGRWDWISAGFTPAGVEAWNAIRGIDLLCNMPSINTQRIGITGRSGGGAYSWFAAALDDRVRVAVPVAGITDLQNHVTDGCVEGHCDCMYFVNYFGWDYGKLAALIAPRPLMLENSDSDSIFPLDGVVRIDRQLRELYQRLDASDSYGLVITPGPHQDTQELRVPAFSWLAKHLLDRELTIEASAEKEVTAGRLAVFEKEIPRDERVTSVSEWFAPAAETVANEETAFKTWRESWQPQLERRRVLREPKPLALYQSQESERRGRRSTVFKDATSGIHVLKVEPVGNKGRTQVPVMHLVLDDRLATNTSGWIKAAAIEQRVEVFPDATHYFVNSRSLGDSQSSNTATEIPTVKSLNQRMRRFYLLGETPEQVAMIDLLAALRWVTQEEAVETVALAGTGREALPVMLASLAATSFEKPVIEQVIIYEYPTDPILAACLPGLWQVCTPEDILMAVGGGLALERKELPSLSTRLLVDSSSEPQQATGMRVVEVTPASAQIWVRATRWPLPNLADLPAVQFESKSGKQSRGAILPDMGVEGLRYAAPGVPAEVRVLYRKSGQGSFQSTEWAVAEAATDYSRLVPIEGLLPETQYELRTQVRQPGNTKIGSSLSGSFRTLPAVDQPANFRLAISTCQGFVDRDGPHGFDLYRTIQSRETDAFVMAGDVVYYDALARTKSLAFYHWQRTYSLPTLVDFHRRMPAFFLKDDHDTYVNDSWPGGNRPWTDEFSFADGQAMFPTQTGLPSPAYRTFLIGSDLQVWLMEGRDFRTPNTSPDSLQKTIWGTQQKAWLEETLASSGARFKVIVSPTPLVGPDRANKNDNHANEGFAMEGERVRKLLASYPNTVSVCGDRHWQFHSIDPQTGLHEFSVGPASDRHAGGWKQSDFRPDIHQYLRVAGGYLELDLAGPGEERRLILRHLDPQGVEHHRHELR